jgi:hypothetical protein
MSIEDRVRAATRARAGQVRQIRPLDLPDELPARGRRSRYTRPARDPRRWLTWGAPLAAAALVTALALALVLLRQAPVPRPGPVATTSAPSVTASIPRYYVTLDHMDAVVGDDRTGRKLAVISTGENIYNVTAAADDRTFVLEESPVGGHATTWYLLRLTLGATHPTQLTKLPIAPIVANIYGFALSPDGSKLALMWRTASTPTDAVAHLSVYSVPAGATLGTWTESGGGGHSALNEGVIGDGTGLTWVDGDTTVAFPWAVEPATADEPPTRTFRALDVSTAGHDLLADSRVVAQVPTSTTQTKTASATPCGVTLLSSDGILVCGSSGDGNASFQPACPTADPTIASYSANGKRLQVLYRWQAAQCLSANTTVLWTSPDGSTAIVSLDLSMKGIKVTAPESSRFGIVSGGHLTVLPPLLAGDYATIAF